jgi:orotidine-5'-phosphate decarboxylase
MVNVHALGGRRMMAAAREALDNLRKPPLLIAVTVLTSMEEKDLREVGIAATLAAAAENLAGLAREEGVDGVVCSAHEARVMRARFGPEFILVTPGIRLAGDAGADQRRIMTPTDAVKAGADYLVIGRSITHSDDPLKKLQAINTEIGLT